MSTEELGRNKLGHDAMATIARADRAYHDPAQFHLHEFGGDQR